MAVVKHISSKNANYFDSIDYLLYEHDELSGKMILDEGGEPVVRERFLMDGINCEPLEYPMAAMEANELYGKNRARGDVKSHHYVLSFDPRDRDVGLTFEEAHEMAMRLAREWFGGHPGIVFTHPEGHNGSGNIHSHIVFCSVRVKDETVREWMTHPSEWQAGGKHHVTREHLDAFKQAVMDMCQERNLHQVDLLDPARKRVTEREFWAQRRLELRRKLDAPERDDSSVKPERQASEEQSPRENGEGHDEPSRYKTHKQQIRLAVLDAASRATDFESFTEILRTYGIEAKMPRGRISYRHPERERSITGRALGVDYEWPVIEAGIRHRLEHGGNLPRQTLVAQIDGAMRSRGAAYVAKVRSSNIRKLSESIAFLQETGLESREELEAALDMSAKSLAAAKESLDATDEALARANRAISASGAYLSTRNTWRAYRASSDRRAFYLAHKRELEKCNVARNELAELFPDGTCPAMNDLKAERRRLVIERNGKYEDWTTARYRHREIMTAKRNVDAVLGGKANAIVGKEETRQRNGEELE